MSDCKENLTFKKNLLKLLKSKKMSQTALAEKIGVTRAAVNSWLINNRQPKISQIYAIANLFNITIDELLTGKKTENKSIRDTLGLSENAIENIKSLQECENNTFKSPLSIFNFIVSNPEFATTMTDISAHVLEVENFFRSCCFYLTSEYKHEEDIKSHEVLKRFQQRTKFEMYQMNEILTKFFLKGIGEMMNEDTKNFEETLKDLEK